jgi:hypothetical protein
MWRNMLTLLLGHSYKSIFHFRRMIKNNRLRIPNCRPINRIRLRFSKLTVKNNNRPAQKYADNPA